MASVIVDELKCVEETDEAGYDDVYLLTFRGRIPPTGSVATQTEFTVHGGYDFWTNFETGETHRGDVVIAAHDPKSLYIVQLIEKDNGRDVVDGVRRLYKQILEGQWALVLSRTIAQPDAVRAAIGTRVISETLRGLNDNAMEFPTGNDDEIGAPQRLSLQASNPAAVVNFAGDGGRYRATIKVA
jgi:hypothetical protein